MPAELSIFHCQGIWKAVRRVLAAYGANMLLSCVGL